MLNILSDRCNTHKDSPFIIEPFEGRSMTYGEMFQWSGVLATEFIHRGIRPRDCVILRFSNRLEFSLSHFALFRLGAIPVTISPAVKRQKWESIMQAVEPKAILTNDPNGCLPASPMVPTISVNVDDVLSRSDAGCGGEHDSVYPYNPSDTLAILYTSGTTGTPKGVMLSYSAVMANFLEYGTAMRFGEGTRIIQSLPVDHADGWCFTVLLPFLFGASVLLVPPFNAAVAGRFDWLLNEHGGNVFVAVPSMMKALLSMAFRYRTPYVGRLTAVLCSSARLTPHDMHTFEREFGTNVYEFYGSTEALLISYFAPDIPYREGSVGKLSPQVRLSFTEEQEMLVHSPFLFNGYLKDPAKTSAVFDGTWLRTGDVGWVDEAGYVYLAGRKQHFINKAGLKIDPAEIDDVIMQLEEVDDCVTIGYPDPVLGEQIYVFVTVKGNNTSETAIYSYLKNELAATHLPKRIMLVDHISRTPIGKVIREELMQTIAAAEAH